MVELTRNSQGISDAIKKIKKSINRGFDPYLIYIKSVGFLVQSNISKPNLGFIEKGRGIEIGHYGVGVKKEWIIDDCLESAANILAIERL